ncbi:MAG TPA: hypothetical protein VFB22_09160 [Candidatus Baltobacteraceae bacterium]|nr:hypothetical protein [Candidatus Baltobacteraceae bacterium]
MAAACAEFQIDAGTDGEAPRPAGGDAAVAEPGIPAAPDPETNADAAPAHASPVGHGTGMWEPYAIAVFPGGSVYVAMESHILVFAPGASGNVAPVREVATYSASFAPNFTNGFAVGAGP